MKFDANLSLLFTERPFLERFDAARRWGFNAVECLLPYAIALPHLRQTIGDLGLSVVLFNCPSGRWENGERGIAALPDRVQEFRDGLKRALEYANGLGCYQLNCLAGIPDTRSSYETCEEVLMENLAYAADLVKSEGVTILLEAINPWDVPGFYLTSILQIPRLLQRLARDNVKILFDAYHVHRVEGEIGPIFRQVRPWVSHIQIADDPGRHEPGTGSIDFSEVFRDWDTLGYSGYVGLEYHPLDGTEASLSWLEPWRTI